MTQEKSTLHADTHLGLESLHAQFKTYSFAKHMHDYYVIGFVRKGAQTFWYRGETHQTNSSGLIFLNPGEAHTGKAAGANGFEYHAFYPTLTHMQTMLEELGRPPGLPFFTEARVDDQHLSHLVETFHQALLENPSKLERESRFIQVLSYMLQRHADIRVATSIKKEPKAVRKAREYLEDNYDQDISLQTLADAVGLSRYYFLRVFHKTAGLPPHAYLESIRIRKAQQLINKGEPLAQIAYMTGFSHQSHFTNRFKYHIGVTPGQYAKKSNILQDNTQEFR
jgi:AraC-like DNA-binding protein